MEKGSGIFYEIKLYSIDTICHVSSVILFIRNILFPHINCDLYDYKQKLKYKNDKKDAKFKILIYNEIKEENRKNIWIINMITTSSVLLLIDIKE